MAEAAEQLPPPQYPSPLERERESASFIASEMAALLYTQRRIDAKRAVADILRADPVLAKLRSREPFLSKKERFADQVSSLLRFRFRPCAPAEWRSVVPCAAGKDAALLADGAGAGLDGRGRHGTLHRGALRPRLRVPAAGRRRLQPVGRHVHRRDPRPDVPRAAGQVAAARAVAPDPGHM